MHIDVSVPDGTSGPWTIDTFTVSKREAFAYNAIMRARGTPWMNIKEGTYKRLAHNLRGTVMSNTVMEVSTNQPIIKAAKGNVLINGLGLGMVLTAILKKKVVKTVTVVEMEQDVINLVAPHFRLDVSAGRLVVVHTDAYKYSIPPGVHYDAVWHDIWDDISDDNFKSMDILRAKYASRATWQGFWGEDQSLAMRASFTALLEANGKSWTDFEAWQAKSQLQGAGL